MRLGRLDPETTANVGTIDGGSAINVVPERCRLEAEARSLDAARAEARRDRDGRSPPGRRQRPRMRPRRDRRADVRGLPHARPRLRRCTLAERGAARLRVRAQPHRHRRRLGRELVRDAGFACTNLANGTERNHQPDERVSVEALEGMFEVAIALVDEAGRVAGARRPVSEFEPIGVDVTWEGKIIQRGHRALPPRRRGRGDAREGVAPGRGRDPRGRRQTTCG